MLIGVDLDNTIIGYDALFHQVARAWNLIPPEAPARKPEIKQWIRHHFGNDTWTKLQGEVYGPSLPQANAQPGVKEFFLHCRQAKFSACIISHKTRFPAVGDRHDLRQAALDWLQRQGWFDPEGIGLAPADVEFHDTRPAKIEAIRRRHCDIFIDDLPEVFAEPDFPSGTARVLFDPDGTHSPGPGAKSASTWGEIEAGVFAGNYA
jgi:hypothetical protein